MNYRMKQSLIKLLYILAGNTMYAAGIALFILPNHLITGGTTGLALFFNRQCNIPITAFVSCFNIAMFLLGLFILGKKFALTTIISTFYYPLIFGLLQSLVNGRQITQDPLLAVLFGGIMVGTGIGLVLKEGASTGGIDIPPLVINKKFAIPVSVSLYAIDFTILLLQIVYSDIEGVLYGILLIMIYTLVLDKILIAGKSQIQVKIISEEYEKINQAIISELDRGSTLIHAETGLKRNKNLVVLSVVSSRELARLNGLIKEIDEAAFVIISQVNEVHGRGFSKRKQYIGG